MSNKINNKITQSYRNRCVFVVICALICFAFVIFNMYKMQIRDYNHYKAKAAEIRLQEVSISPERGKIYDANMKILATTTMQYEIFVSPEESKPEQHEIIAETLGKYLGIEPEEILKKLAKEGSFYQLLKKKVDKPLADKIKGFCSKNGIKGVNIIENAQRSYPYGNFASTILGFCGSDNQGLAGLENYYNTELSGVAGRQIEVQNGWGLNMETSAEILSPVQNGYGLVTTIDETIQHYLEKELAANAEKHKVEEGAVGIVMNVKTGAILAMSSYPTYDPNDPYTLTDQNLYDAIMALETDEEINAAMSNARQKQWRNKAVNDLYEPGSVFKIITASAALDSGAAALSSNYNCRGSIVVENRIMKCAQTWGHGHETFAQALINSCNPAFIEIGQKMGIQSFWEYFYAFGLSEKTGIDLPGEQNSLHYNANTHTIVTLSSSAFGQSNKVTPIQMITAVAAAVNGGNLVTPHIASKLIDEQGNVVKDLTPEIRRQVISEGTSEEIRKILQENSTTGNGQHAYVAGYRVGGKSGTSQKLDTERDDDYIASFLGVAPCDDPEIAILIFFDTPTGEAGFFGGPLAGTVVGSLMGKVLPHLGIQQKYAPGEEKESITTPSIVDYDITDAAVKLQRAGLTIKIIGSGEKVISQYPAWGQKVGSSSMIIAYTEPGEPMMVTVPNLVGKTLAQVKSTMASLGLNYKAVGSTNDSTVISQDIVGEQVQLGTVINFTFNGGNFAE